MGKNRIGVVEMKVEELEVGKHYMYENTYHWNKGKTYHKVVFLRTTPKKTKIYFLHNEREYDFGLNCIYEIDERLEKSKMILKLKMEHAFCFDSYFKTQRGYVDNAKMYSVGISVLQELENILKRIGE